MALLDQIFREDIRLREDGSPRTIGQRENVRSAVENRFSTQVGRIPFLPTYGAQLKKYQGRVITPDFINSIKAEIKNNITSDPRVDRLQSISIEWNEEGRVNVAVSFSLVSTQEIQKAEVII